MNVHIVNYKPGHQPAFEKLNRAWIEKHFTLETLDIEVLSNPGKHILENGGYILVALADDIPAGVVALRKLEDGIFELTKMAVDETVRGKGIGKKLMMACLQKGREIGARTIILYSNRTHNVPAIELYRKIGFVEIPMGEALYKRGNIKMEFVLTPVPHRI
jgi:ribosomal protein S18 acetylase RimI-like enzyme